MARTKMVVRIVSDQRQRLFQKKQQAAQCRRIRSGVRNIEGKVRNKTLKKTNSQLLYQRMSKSKKTDRLFKE